MTELLPVADYTTTREPAYRSRSRGGTSVSFHAVYRSARGLFSDSEWEALGVHGQCNAIYSEMRRLDAELPLWVQKGGSTTE